MCLSVEAGCIPCYKYQVFPRKAKMPKSVTFKPIDHRMTREELLVQKGWYSLREVFTVLDPSDTGKYKLAFKQIKRVIEKGDDPYETMGRKKFGGRVGVRMERFAPWYRANPMFRTEKLEPDLSFQDFLKKADVYFRLSEVCKVYRNNLPYSYAILKREADKHPDSLHAVGIVKCDTTYLVSMPGFEKWLRTQLL